MTLLFLVCVAALAYVYFGYLLALRLLVWVRGPRPVRIGAITPRVSLVISAFNEAAVIRSKIENALELTYPDGQLEIAVISDASDDGTDEIVREYAPRGVRLFRQAERRGKTAGLNAVVPQLTGEIVVFSDANAMYRPEAVEKLVRNFADPDVGCVTGEARYVRGSDATADAGERVYWNYEMYVKRLETALGSMVGGDGAIYAIRRALWRTLPDNAINDFLNPLQIVAAGWRGVYEPEAICLEEPGGGTRIEYRRRVRIVSRSWRAIFQAPGVLNPRRVGLFAWSVFSHKMLRWMSGLFAAGALVSLVAITVGPIAQDPTSLLVLAAVFAVIVATAKGRQRVAMLGYFAVIIAASIVGVFKGTLGNVSGVWAPPRAQEAGRRPALKHAPVGRAFLVACVVVLGAGWAIEQSVGTTRVAELLFWSAVAFLFYVYVGYPAVLAALRLVVNRAPTVCPIEPTVCVFIAANDEAAVIESKLHNTMQLDYPAGRLEIVVASDGSVDGTNEIVRRFAPRVRLIEFSPRRGKIAVINEGLRSVGSEIVLFSDANTYLERGAVRAAVRNFADARVGAVSGDVVLVGERAALGLSEDLYYRYERWIQRAESLLGSMIGVDGALYAIRRELFVAPPNDTILDDMAIPMAIVRAGHRVVFEPGARGLEQGSETAWQEFARKCRVVAGAVQFLGRHDSSVPLRSVQVMFSLISHKALRWLSPAFAMTALVASVLLAPSSQFYAITAAAQCALLAIGLAGCIPRLRRMSVVSLAHYFCLVQAASAVGFVRGITRSQSVRWQRFTRAPVEAA